MEASTKFRKYGESSYYVEVDGVPVGLVRKVAEGWRATNAAGQYVSTEESRKWAVWSLMNQ